MPLVISPAIKLSMQTLGMHSLVGSFTFATPFRITKVSVQIVVCRAIFQMKPNQDERKRWLLNVRCIQTDTVELVAGFGD